MLSNNARFLKYSGLGTGSVRGQTGFAPKMQHSEKYINQITIGGTDEV